MKSLSEKNNEATASHRIVASTDGLPFGVMWNCEYFTYSLGSNAHKPHVIGINVNEFHVR